MLFIKVIYLLLSHLPTSPTTVRAVRHTAVSCFYTSRCVTSCFQPSLRDTSLLFYCRIPSYRVNREFLFAHLTTKDSQGSSHLLLYCTIQSFPLGNPCLGHHFCCQNVKYQNIKLTFYTRLIQCVFSTANWTPYLTIHIYLPN